MQVETDSGKIVITVDEGVTAGSGCTQSTPQEIFCDPSALVVVTGGDFDDTLVAKELSVAATVQLFGGGGVDHVTGNSAANLLDGGAGDDVIAGRDGEVDLVDCGDGADTVTAEAADVLSSCETAQLPPLPPPARVTPTFTFQVKDKTRAQCLAPGSTTPVAC